MWNVAINRREAPGTSTCENSSFREVSETVKKPEMRVSCAEHGRVLIPVVTAVAEAVAATAMAQGRPGSRRPPSELPSRPINRA